MIKTKWCKWCSRCKSLQQTADFGPNTYAPDGLQKWCKICVREYRAKFSTKSHMASTLLLLIGVQLNSADSHAAISGEWRVTLLRGSTTVQPYSTGATQEAAWQACQARIPRAAPLASYTCQTPRYVASVSPDPVDVLVPSAPATISAMISSATQITVTWGAATDNVGVTGSVVEVCRGVDCTDFAEVSRFSGPRQYVHAISSASEGSTWNFRVRAYDAAGNVSAPSPVATVIQPVLSVAGAALLSWSAPTHHTDGSVIAGSIRYRIVYGRTADALAQSVLVPQQSGTTHQLTGLVAGSWYFAVIATTTQDSGLSNIVSKMVL